MEGKFRRKKEQLLNKLDFPSEISMDLPRVIVVGNREITVENHSGIIAFENNMVKIKSRIGVVTIYGENFKILFIGDTSMTMSGKFKGIEYEEKKA